MRSPMTVSVALPTEPGRAGSTTLPRQAKSPGPRRSTSRVSVANTRPSGNGSRGLPSKAAKSTLARLELSRLEPSRKWSNGRRGGSSARTGRAAMRGAALARVRSLKRMRLLLRAILLGVPLDQGFLDAAVGNQPHDGYEDVQQAGKPPLDKGACNRDGVDHHRHLALEVAAHRHGESGLLAVGRDEEAGQNEVGHSGK